MPEETTIEEMAIRQNVKQSRFEGTVAGQVSVVEYELNRGTLNITHTLVPPSLRGRGVAGRLVEHVLGYAREKGLKVVADCNYVAHYIDRHPQFQDLLAAE